ncbi:putative ASCH domain-containing protein [uncultured Thiomicrorhabdus sp.]
MSVITIVVKRKFFEQIKSGKKKEEYREIKDYWVKRLNRKGISKVKLKVGYPKIETEDNTLICKFKGYEKKTVETETFGKALVFAIDVSEPIS